MAGAVRPRAPEPSRWTRTRVRPRRAPVAVLLVTSLLTLASSCGRIPGEEARGTAGGFPSREALSRAVLEAIERRDREALESFLLTEEEHRSLLWDQLPESGYFTFPYVRRLTERATRKAIRRTLERYGGRPLRFAGLSFEKGTEAYDGFTLHRGAALRVRDARSGEEGVIPVLDVLVERNGRWKPMDYDE